MQRAPVTRSLRNGPIAQDSSVNDQTRFTMRRRCPGLRSCVRSGSQDVVIRFCELLRQPGDYTQIPILPYRFACLRVFAPDETDLGRVRGNYVLCCSPHR
jgi:hypothetical protein